MNFLASFRNWWHFVAALILGLASAGIQGQSRLSTAPAVAGDDAPISPQSVVRTIDDPSSGARWLLVCDIEHRGGPGRLILAPIPHSDGKAASTNPIPSPFAAVIRAGDRLLIETHTVTADARFEAVALGPARLGAPLDVRLNIGGRRVRALAAGPGRAILAPETEGWKR